MEKNKAFEEWLDGYATDGSDKVFFDPKINSGLQHAFQAGQESALNLPGKLGECVVEQPTPNCAKCRWIYESWIRRGETKIEDLSICKAQGCKNSETAYNTDECRALYEPEKENEG